jgi:hypothetical protein
MHRVDCAQCGRYQECWGEDLRHRLEELRQFERQKEGPATAQEQATKQTKTDAA